MNRKKILIPLILVLLLLVLFLNILKLLPFIRFNQNANNISAIKIQSGYTGSHVIITDRTVINKLCDEFRETSFDICGIDSLSIGYSYKISLLRKSINGNYKTLDSFFVCPGIVIKGFPLKYKAKSSVVDYNFFNIIVGDGYPYYLYDNKETTVNNRIALLRIPKKYLASMTTQQLIESVYNFPFILGYTINKKGIDDLCNECDAFSELLNRDDFYQGIDHAIKQYNYQHEQVNSSTSKEEEYTVRIFQYLREQAEP